MGDGNTRKRNDRRMRFAVDNRDNRRCGASFCGRMSRECAFGMEQILRLLEDGTRHFFHETEGTAYVSAVAISQSLELQTLLHNQCFKRSDDSVGQGLDHGQKGQPMIQGNKCKFSLWH